MASDRERLHRGDGARVEPAPVEPAATAAPRGRAIAPPRAAVPPPPPPPTTAPRPPTSWLRARS